MTKPIIPVRSIPLIAQIVGAVSTMFVGTASFVAAQVVATPELALQDTIGSVTGMGGLGMIGFALFRWLFAQYQAKDLAEKEARERLLVEKDRQIERLSTEVRDLQTRWMESVNRPRS
jgi:hypothetical protein